MLDGSRARALARAATVVGLVSVAAPARAAVPHHDHVVVVVMENKGYDQVRGQPYTASLIAEGALFTQAHAITHPSQPNYIALWAASTLGVRGNECPASGSPFSAGNLGHACEAAGRSWRAYSEDLATAGSPACSQGGGLETGSYTRKHEPWTQFSNLDHMNERPYGDLAADIASRKLPNLAFVIPNNCHNTHNSGSRGCGIKDGDAWLAANLPAIRSALGPRGLLILTWDEDDNGSGNHILTVFAGAQVSPGTASNRPVTHYTVVRAICDALGLAPFGAAADEQPIEGIWRGESEVAPSWGSIKAGHR